MQKSFNIREWPKGFCHPIWPLCRVGDGKKAEILKLWSFSTESRRSYLDWLYSKKNIKYVLSYDTPCWFWEGDEIVGVFHNRKTPMLWGENDSIVHLFYWIINSKQNFLHLPLFIWWNFSHVAKFKSFLSKTNNKNVHLDWLIGFNVRVQKWASYILHTFWINPKFSHTIRFTSMNPKYFIRV